jgi:subtilase family serine protease
VRIAFVLPATALLAVALVPLGAAAATAAPPIHLAHAKSVCAAPTRPGFAACMAKVRTDIAAKKVFSPSVSGLGPSDLQGAYQLASAAASNGVGTTVAIVDAFDNPNAFSDVNTYRANFGLPALASCDPSTIAGSTTPCFAKSDENGGTNFPAGDLGWEAEESLDVDMVSAICPNCNILLVEGNQPSFVDLGTSVNTAVSLGANAVSNSYGGGEQSGQTSFDADYNHPGVAVTASSGDNGFGVEFPAASPFVTAVGGTSLVQDGSARGWSETAWSGAGSGCSAFESKPSWQTDGGCGNRTVADVSAVADPNTGVAVFDTNNGGWLVFGGTSVASPIIASVYGLAGNTGSLAYAQSLYQNPGALFDVTSGSNGNCGSYLCTAGPGYDGPTGLGTPDGTGAF